MHVQRLVCKRVLAMMLACGCRRGSLPLTPLVYRQVGSTSQFEPQVYLVDGASEGYPVVLSRLIIVVVKVVIWDKLPQSFTLRGSVRGRTRPAVQTVFECCTFQCLIVRMCKANSSPLEAFQCSQPA
jgi:hypothetical protein